jgi:hypothetical protein
MIVYCKNCGKEFEKKNKFIKRSPNHFCCRQCSAAWNNRNSPKREPEGYCVVCNKSISTKLKYCSDECRNTNKKPLRSYAEIGREYRKNRKIKCIEYKGGKCKLCGYNRSTRALQFHHLDPKQKDFTISQPNGISWELTQLELDKCILVCSNCHAEIHDGLHSTL